MLTVLGWRCVQANSSCKLHVSLKLFDMSADIKRSPEQALLEVNAE